MAAWYAEHSQQTCRSASYESVMLITHPRLRLCKQTWSAVDTLHSSSLACSICEPLGCSCAIRQPEHAVSTWVLRSLTRSYSWEAACTAASRPATSFFRPSALRPLPLSPPNVCTPSTPLVFRIVYELIVLSWYMRVNVVLQCMKFQVSECMSYHLVSHYSGFCQLVHSIQLNCRLQKAAAKKPAVETAAVDTRTHARTHTSAGDKSAAEGAGS